MDESVKNQNRDLVIKWIESNPNFSGLNFGNNAILFSNGSKINLGNFLLSSLLENVNFSSILGSMDEYLLYKILYANTEVYNVYNMDPDNQEYIKNVQLTNQGTVLIITNSSKIEISDVKSISVLTAYNSLLNNSQNGYVYIDELFKKIGKYRLPSIRKDIPFFELLDRNDTLKINEVSYVEYFSKYMYTLMCYQGYLVGDAKKLLDNYNTRIAGLIDITNLNDTQKKILDLYNDNIKAYALKTQKETSPRREVSIGFSSIALIIVSVVVTLSLIVLLIIIH